LETVQVDAAERGQLQGAYRVLVATQARILADDTGDLWDTGEVFARGQGWPPPDNTMPDPWFRRVFDLDQKPRRAVAYVASIGYHELYVNGHKVGDAVLVPSVTDNSKRARYLTYEITQHLQAGTNVVGLWLGMSWSIFPPFETKDRPRTPLAIGQIDVEMPGGGPAWSGFCITLPWEVYLRYGDTRILAENFSMMQRWLDFLETKAKDDLLVRWGGEWDFLGDWLWPGAKGVNGDTPETLFFNNGYWIYNIQIAASIAEILGKHDAAVRYRQRADAIRRAVHARFFHPEDNSYANGLPAYLAMALLVGMPPQDLRPAVWKRLEHEILVNHKGHIWAGITGGAFLMKTLLEADRHDLIYEMVRQEDYPGWGDQLRSGATTFWESWEDSPGLSYLHSSCLYVGSWFIEGLAGIRPDPDGGGFKHVVIKPAVLADRGLTRVTATYESLYGPIQSAWEVSDETLDLNVTITPNTTGTVIVPAASADDVREQGAPSGRCCRRPAISERERVCRIGRVVGELLFQDGLPDEGSWALKTSSGSKCLPSTPLLSMPSHRSSMVA